MQLTSVGQLLYYKGYKGYKPLHENENVRYIGQGEAPHRKYKRLKLGGGHVYDCSSV
jgi:hypothetical protein